MQANNSTVVGVCYCLEQLTRGESPNEDFCGAASGNDDVLPAVEVQCVHASVVASQCASNETLAIQIPPSDRTVRTTAHQLLATLLDSIHSPGVALFCMIRMRKLEVDEAASVPIVLETYSSAEEEVPGYVSIL